MNYYLFRSNIFQVQANMFLQNYIIFYYTQQIFQKLPIIYQKIVLNNTYLDIFAKYYQK